MKRLLTLILLSALCSAAQSQPEQKPNDHPKVRQYFMAILVKGPKWVDISATPQGSPERQLAAEHLKGLAALIDQDKATAVGPLADGGDMQGIIIYQVATQDEATHSASQDPFVKSGFMKPEVHPWYTVPDAFAKAPFSMNLGTHYLVFLLKGDQSEKLSDDGRKKLQEAHMANIRKLGEEGKLSVAGPFDRDPKLRGIFVIEAASKDQARTYVETDPMIQRGRLKYEIYTWRVPKGLLAAAKQ